MCQWFASVVADLVFAQAHTKQDQHVDLLSWIAYVRGLLVVTAPRVRRRLCRCRHE